MRETSHSENSTPIPLAAVAVACSDLFDSLQREFISLDENAHRIVHELGRELQHIVRHRRRHQHGLSGLRQVAPDVVQLICARQQNDDKNKRLRENSRDSDHRALSDRATALTLESLAQHLIGFINDEHFEFRRVEMSALNHIIHSSRCSADDLHSILQCTNILSE